MIPPRLRAALVIGAVAVASAIAGAAIDRALLANRAPAARSGDFGRRAGPEQDERRRREMLEKMSETLSLTAAQRAGLDSVFQRTDSSLRAIRRASMPQIQQVFEQSRAEINARLDSTQRVKFAAMRPNRGVPDEFRGGRRGGRGGPGGHDGRGRGDSARQ